MKESLLAQDKGPRRSNLNSTMAVALTARQFASRRGVPRLYAVAGPLDTARIEDRP
jgi:hypothetical protein